MDWTEMSEDELSNMAARIKELEGLVKEAYSEGWHDCYEHRKEYTILNDWNKSALKRKVEQVLKEGG